MCLAEFSVYSNLKPCPSTDRIVDLPQVTSCGPGPVSLPGAFISCGYFPCGLVGPMIALAQALTLPNDGNDRAILVQGDEGSTQVVRLGHRGTPSIKRSDEVAISSPPRP